MILKVDPDELLDVSKVMKTDSEKFTEEIKSIEKSLGIIRKNWNGTDADAYINNFSNFVTKMKGLPKSLDTLAKICDDANKGYVTIDQDFAKELREEAVESEQ